MITKAQAAGGGSVAVLGAGGSSAGILLGNKDSEDETFTENTTPKVMNITLSEGQITKFVVLAMDDDFDTEYGTDVSSSNITVGKRYGWYLMSIYDENNKEWWEKTYEKWTKETPDADTTYEHFKKSNIKSAFADKGTGTSDGKALNQVCEEIAKGKIENSLYEDKDVFKYCSPMGKTPEDINSSGEFSTYDTTGTVGKNANLISVNNKDNDIFWKLRNYDFFGKDNEDGLGANLSNDTTSLFKNLYSTKAKNRGSIRNVCSQAYQLLGDGENDLFVKLCGWGTN